MLDETLDDGLGRRCLSACVTLLDQYCVFLAWSPLTCRGVWVVPPAQDIGGICVSKEKRRRGPLVGYNDVVLGPL